MVPPRQLWRLLFLRALLALPPRQVDGASAKTSGGRISPATKILHGFSDCPCIDHIGEAEWSAVIAQHVVTQGNCTQLQVKGEPMGLPRGYGSGECSTWDDNTAHCREQLRDDSCGEARGEHIRITQKWCASRWCYVNPRHCPHRTHYGSKTFPGMFYSYVTCGNINSYKMDRYVREMEKYDEIRIAYPGIGWSKLWQDGHAEYKQTAYFGETVLMHLGLEEHQIKRRNVSDFSMQMYPGHSYEACVHDVALGTVDMCLGDFWDLPAYSLSTAMSAAVYMEGIYVIANTAEQEQSLGEILHTPFLPFSWYLWGLIGSVVVLTGLVLAYLERGHNEDDFPDERPHAVATKSMYLSALGYVCGGPAHSPTTSGGRIVALGYGFFLLICLASFTANTATFLMSYAADPMIASLSDAVRLNKKMCINDGLVDVVQHQHGEASHLLVPKVDEADEIEGLQSGECEVLIAHMAILEIPQSKGELCDYSSVGQPVATLAVTFPVRDELNAAMEWSITAQRMSGKFSEAQRAHPVPASTCSGSSDTADTLADMQLTPANFMGTCLLLIFCMIAGVVVQFLEQAGREVAKVLPVEILPEQHSAPNEDIKTLLCSMQKQMNEVQQELRERKNDNSIKAS